LLLAEGLIPRRHQPAALPAKTTATALSGAALAAFARVTNARVRCPEGRQRRHHRLVIVAGCAAGYNRRQHQQSKDDYQHFLHFLSPSSVDIVGYMPQIIRPLSGLIITPVADANNSNDVKFILQPRSL
jgi:hypothetical protein